MESGYYALSHLRSPDAFARCSCQGQLNDAPDPLQHVNYPFVHRSIFPLSYSPPADLWRPSSRFRLPLSDRKWSARQSFSQLERKNYNNSADLNICARRTLNIFLHQVQTATCFPFLSMLVIEDPMRETPILDALFRMQTLLLCDLAWAMGILQAAHR